MTDLVLQVITTLINRDAKASAVRNALANHLSSFSDEKVSEERANKLLAGYVDTGRLFCIQIGKDQYYAYDKTKTLASVMGQYVYDSD